MWKLKKILVFTRKTGEKKDKQKFLILSHKISGDKSFHKDTQHNQKYCGKIGD